MLVDSISWQSTSIHVCLTVITNILINHAVNFINNVTIVYKSCSMKTLIHSNYISNNKNDNVNYNATVLLDKC